MTLDVKQKKVLEWQIMQQNMQMIKQREQEISIRLEELIQTRGTLEELASTKPEKALIPIGSGNYLDGAIDDVKHVTIGVGAGIAVKKTREEALKMVDDRAGELSRALSDIHNEEHRVNSELQKITQELQKLEKR